MKVLLDLFCGAGGASVTQTATGFVIRVSDGTFTTVSAAQAEALMNR